jgi:hypothetical protein
MCPEIAPKDALLKFEGWVHISGLVLPAEAVGRTLPEAREVAEKAID